VFVVTNALILLTAVIGEVIFLRNRRSTKETLTLSPPQG
jgi:hypothetical protein